MVNKVSIEKKEKEKKNLEIVVTLMSRAGRHLFLRCRSSASLMLGSSTVYIGKTECVCAGHLFIFFAFRLFFIIGPAAAGPPEGWAKEMIVE